MDKITLQPIGTIHSPHKDIAGMPIQPSFAADINGTIEMLPQFAAGLKDLEGFSHIILIYNFHKSGGFSLEATPFLDKTPRGLFATRAPRRPNPLGLSIVRLEKIDGATLHISGVDILDGTPLLDIKPYVPRFDCRPDATSGWLEKKSDADKTVSDSRFREEE